MEINYPTIISFSSSPKISVFRVPSTSTFPSHETLTTTGFRTNNTTTVNSISTHKITASISKIAMILLIFLLLYSSSSITLNSPSLFYRVSEEVTGEFLLDLPEKDILLLHQVNIDKMVNVKLCLYVFSLFICLKEVSPEKVPLTLVKNAVDKGAVCLDGSPPAYQFDKGFGEGVNNWLVDLEGGAWCETPHVCRRRRRYDNGLGSSHLMKEQVFQGILSRNPRINPNFYNWNRINVRYCDGSSFTGDKEEVNATDPVYYRGARVFDAIMEDLLEKGMKNASNALLSGHSAGGLAAILHCDKFRDLLPKTSKVKCFSDAGYFTYVKDITGGYHFEEVMFRRVVETHGSAKNLPQSCTSRMNASLCFYPQHIAPVIKTPLFILNSVFDIWQVIKILALSNIPAGQSWIGCQYEMSNCTTSQIERLKVFGEDVINAVLTGLPNNSTRGIFMNTCRTHCQAINEMKWTGKHGSKINNKSAADALGEWYYGDSPVELIEKENMLPHWCVLDLWEPNPATNYTWNG